MPSFSLKPIAILEYDRDNGPAYFGEYLRREKIPFEQVHIDQGAPVPQSIAPYGGLCLMGGSLSVNDDLPWIVDVLT